MKNSCDVLALVPARGGSKGIPGKNLRLLGGIPLVAHAIRNARAAVGIKRVVLSTDSIEIAEVGRREGAEVPFLRPAELARDESAMMDVVLHAFRTLCEGGGEPSAVVLLQPTSPLLRPSTIESALQAFRESGARLLKGVRRVRDHPAWMLQRRSDDRTGEDRLVPFLDGPPVRRQDLPQLFIPCGAIYIYDASFVRSPREGEPAAWLELSWPESLDIDEPADLHLAEWALAAGASGGPGR